VKNLLLISTPVFNVLDFSESQRLLFFLQSAPYLAGVISNASRW